MKYRSVAPWSYSSSGEEFSVCVDCWVPRPIAASRGRRRKIRRKDKSGDQALDGTKSLKDVAEDANCVAEKKIEAAAMARQEALRKAVVARRAVELATNALDFVARRNEVVDDAEMAIRLHRAMNSSTRTSRNLLVRGSSLRNPIREVCTENKSVSEHLYHDGDSSTDMDCPKPDGRKDCESENVGAPMKEGKVSFSIKLFNSDRDDNSMDSANRSEDERYKGKPNRYLFKYCRRNRRPKATLDGFHLVNQASAAGLVISCSNESTTMSNFSFQCCAVPLQASGRGSSSSLHDSPQGNK